MLLLLVEGLNKLIYGKHQNRVWHKVNAGTRACCPQEAGARALVQHPWVEGVNKPTLQMGTQRCQEVRRVSQGDGVGRGGFEPTTLRDSLS